MLVKRLASDLFFLKKGAQYRNKFTIPAGFAEDFRLHELSPQSSPAKTRQTRRTIAP